jgi:hypothetical protein
VRLSSARQLRALWILAVRAYWHEYMLSSSADTPVTRGDRLQRLSRCVGVRVAQVGRISSTELSRSKPSAVAACRVRKMAGIARPPLRQRWPGFGLPRPSGRQFEPRSPVHRPPRCGVARPASFGRILAVYDWLSPHGHVDRAPAAAGALLVLLPGRCCIVRRWGGKLSVLLPIG